MRSLLANKKHQSIKHPSGCFLVYNEEKEEIVVPIRKLKSGGYKFGSKGKVYPTRKQAVRQGAAIKISQAKRRKK